jgi:hypothetical protein
MMTRAARDLGVWSPCFMGDDLDSLVRGSKRVAP